MDDKELNSTIDKYLRGECNAAELDSLFTFIRSNPDDQRIGKLIEMQWDGSIAGIPEERLKEAYGKTDLTLESIWDDQRIKPRLFWSISKIAIAAASVLILLSIGIGYWKHNPTNSIAATKEVYLSNNPSTLQLPNGEQVSILEVHRQDVVLFENNSAKVIQVAADEIRIIDKTPASEKNELLVLEVAKGKKMKISFGDGSISWVNADSKLVFPLQFAKSNRTVELSGEGYFEVNHAKERPFYVKGVEQLVQVYGTRFNIRNYTTEDKNCVTLFEGKLSVRKKSKSGYGEEKMLASGDQFELHKSSEKVELATINKERITAEWKEARVYYDNAPLKDIFLDLSHQYVIDMDWQAIPDMRFQGYLPEGSDLDKILDILSKTANIKIKRINNTISF